MESANSRKAIENIGAGEGNRTLVFSLEGCCSTIELHPLMADHLSRPAGRLNRNAPARTRKAPCSPSRALVPLTGADSMPILMFHQQRKEVIQCLIPSAVTSLGSPARPDLGPATGRSQRLDQRVAKVGTRRDHPRRVFFALSACLAALDAACAGKKP
jgi:hypothetical protein